VNQPKKNNSIVAAIAAFMAIILLAFGAYLQVPILEGLTHDAHHTQKEIYAFAAEIEESVEEDRSDFQTVLHSFDSVLVAIVQKSCLNGLCFWDGSLSRLEQNNHSFISPFNRKIYLLFGLLSSQLP
jgi:hypothetical protein